MELGTVNFIASSSFLCVLDVFIQTYKSITWNLNMFTLSVVRGGILFGLVGMFFFLMFSRWIQTHNGTVSLYFEATTVILTLVLLGQLLEARAHSQTSGAIKNVEISTNRSHFGHRRSDKIISIHDIKRDLLRVKPEIKFLWMGKLPMEKVR
jgi:Cu2+-exporting ATPase